MDEPEKKGRRKGQFKSRPSRIRTEWEQANPLYKWRMAKKVSIKQMNNYFDIRGGTLLNWEVCGVVPRKFEQISKLTGITVEEWKEWLNAKPDDYEPWGRGTRNRGRKDGKPARRQEKFADFDANSGIGGELSETEIDAPEE